VTFAAITGLGADPSLGAGRLFAGSDESPDLASSLTLCLPTSCPDVRWGAPAPPPDALLQLPAGRADFFFLRESAV